MSFFGHPTDIIEQLADEIGASAKYYPEVKDQMAFLANQLERLSPLYEELCKYGDDPDRGHYDVHDVFRDVRCELLDEFKDGKS